MGDEVKIEKDAFQDRLKQLTTIWSSEKKAQDGLFAGVGSIVILLGKADDAPYQKNNALHFWLLGYEFPATLMVFTPDSLHVVTTSKKAKHLEPLTGGKIPLVIHVRAKEKEAEANQKIWDDVLDVVKKAGKRVGLLTKVESKGPFADEWRDAFKKISEDVEEVNISDALSSVLAVKDENELRAIRSASKACTVLMTEFIDEMSDVIDEDKKVTNEKLGKIIDKKIDEPKTFASKKVKLPADFDQQQLDFFYGPVIQSGGNYDLTLRAESNQSNFSSTGVIIAGMGLRYRSYCSLLARTYLVDPSKKQEETYKFLIGIHETIILAAKDGATAKELYNKALGVIRAKKPELEKHFLKNVGAGIGIESRDSSLLLSGKNSRVLKDGMSLCIMTGFADMENPNPQNKSDKTYSLFLADTIRIKKDGSAIVFTRDAGWDIDSATFFFKDEEEEQKEAPKKTKKDSRIGAVAASNITKNRLRAERSTQVDEGAEMKRKQHQKELASKKQQEGLQAYKKGHGSLNGTVQKKFKRFESYKRDAQLPPSVKDLAIIVDDRNMTVILPIMGRPVPFHINTIKNASASEEGEWAFLRINFLSPGQGVGRKDDQPFEDANAHFVRSLSFRSMDRSRMNQIADRITNLRKEMVKKEQEKKEFEDVVEQDKLIEIRNRKPARLDGVFVRPALEGKRISGEIEIHQNGVLYRDGKGARIEVLFSNTKHLFFQPCQGELIVIIHFHLKNPILIGKRKTKDVQFYREATDMQFDETGNRKRRHRMGDEEEFEMEQEERRRRAALDKEFKAYAERIQSASDGEFGVDVPFRDLGFQGVPFRSNVLMQPTTDCLVQLTEPPFTVITLDEIEVAHLERVQFGLKNFDMVFVYKDYNRPPTHVNTIPVESLEAVKDWLDSCNLAYSEGPLNLNWTTIMKTVTADPHQFYVEGGWSFLQADSDDENVSEEDEESAFEISDSELAQSDESSEEDSEFDDDASADASAEDDMSEEDEGEDWDELERKAAKKDRENGMNDDEDKGRKRKR